MANVPWEVDDTVQNVPWQIDDTQQQPTQFDPFEEQRKQGNFLMGALKGASNISASIPIGLKAATEAILAGEGTSGARQRYEQGKQELAQSFEQLANTQSTPFQVGQLGAEIAGTAAVQGPRAASYLGKIASGTGAGAAGGAMVGQDAQTIGLGAGIGGAFSAAVPVASRLMTGNLDRARNALSRLLGGDTAEAQRVLAAASPDVTSAQALEMGGQLNPTAAAGMGLLRGEVRNAPNPQEAADFYVNLQRQQAAAQQAELASMARGGTQVETNRAIQDFMRQTEQELGPRRTVFLAQLAYGGDEANKILPQLNQLEQDYVAALRRQGMLQTEAGQAISSVTPRAGMIPAETTGLNVGQRLPTVQRGVGELPKPIDEAGYQRAMNEASQQGDIASQARLAADDLRQQLSTLPAPFTAAPIRQAVERLQGEVGSVRRTVADRVAAELRIAGDDPAKIAEVRKLGVNQLLGDLIDSGTLAKTDAAAALTDIKKVIDQQLGQDMVSKYFDPYSKKLAYRSSLEALAELKQMQAKSPKEFMDIIKGDNTAFLDKYSMTASDLKDLLGGKRTGKLEGIAGQMQRDINIAAKETDSAAVAAAKKIFETSGFRGKLPNMLNHWITLANTALGAGEMVMNKKMYALLDKAARDPKAMAELLGSLPPEQRNAMLRYATQASGTAVPAVAGSAMMDQE